MVYITPFNCKTGQATAPSMPSGYDTIEQAVESMGAPPTNRSDRIAMYRMDGVEGIFFSYYQVKRAANGNGQH